ncbi:sulfite reductase subunit alpha [Cohnella boryungensis]|uniref:Sulfite reductase subunit alpha n=1 Tax=Cohnella boryungensis TaxID=768479 RepID=A0ABV8SDB0_9BACL
MSTTKVRSVCPYCGVGCGIVLEVSDNRVVKVAGDKKHPANYGRLCTKGSTSAQAIRESGRLEHAYRRADRGAAPSRVGIDEAIRFTAAKLRGILDRHGPDSLAFYVSGQMSLESQYLINKLAKGFVRTNHIESNSRLCMASAGSGYKLSLGADGPPGSYQDMDQADLFFVIGANMADCHPILFLRVMDRVKAGAKLIVVDPRRNATADKATLFLQIRPGTDLALLNGLLHLIVKNGHTDTAFIEQFTSGWEGMPEFLEDYPPDKVAELTGIPEAAIRQAAQWIGEAAEWISCWTMGLNQSTHGTWHTNAICNLHLATGKICRPGSGPFSLTGQPNAMGGREMGYMGPGLPGQRSVLIEDERQFAESLWDLPPNTLRAESGTGTVSMFEKMRAGEIKACWIICTNPIASVPNRSNVIAGLEAAEWVVAQDAFFDTETNRFADMLLPGALWSEAEGVMINSERNLTLMQKAVEPPGEALPDWRIIARIACEMGYSSAFAYDTADDVYREIQQAWNPKTGYDLRGASYERLRQSPLQWPCAPETSHDRNPIRYLNNGISQNLMERPDGTRPRLVFPTASGKANFLARPFMPPAEMPDDDFPFVLNTGRLQHQWHTMTKTGKIPTLNKLNPGPFVEIHPEDAAALGIADKQPVTLASRRGRAVLPASVTDKVLPGNCFAPIHWNDVFGENLAINAVTNDALDPVSYQPEFKFCAVALSRSASESPVPPSAPSEGNVLSQSLSGDKEEIFMAKVDTLASLLGIDSLSELKLEGHEKLYIAGFMKSLRTDDSRMASGIPVLPPSAPMDASKRYWLDGMLAGMFSRTYFPETSLPIPPVEINLPAQSADENAAPRPRVAVIWASQTGNAETAAIACAAKLKAVGYEVLLTAMDAYVLADLPSESNVLFVTSTFGAGDPPDNGETFWKALQADQAPSLSGLRYAILAFGDSSYDLFCGFGRSLDARLEQLGAKRLAARLDCDTDVQESARQSWLQSVEEALKPAAHDATQKTVARTYDRNNPLRTRLLVRRQLSKNGSEKDTRHYAFDLRDSGMRYEVGDALGILPTNCPTVVGEIVTATRMSPSAPVQWKGQTIPLSEALLHHCEIGRIAPLMLTFVHERSRSEQLERLLKPENRAELKGWLHGRQLVDLLQQFPIETNAEDFVGALKPLQPRLYSISSSSKATPDEVHITVSTVRYSQDGKTRNGICSAFLADRIQSDTEVPIFVQKANHFRPPANPDLPMIMVGPGTGVGPFRGFLQERQVVGAKGKNWLIFGEQRAEFDFYFQEELEEMQRSGLLSRLDTAFSRDQPEKIYVQHRMLEHGAELWSWLQEQAHFFVCGDASRMAKEVETALVAVIRDHGGMRDEAAEAYVKEMARTKRYARDVY